MGLSLPEKTSDDVFQEPHRLLFDELSDHITQYCANGVESLISMAYVPQPRVVK